VRVDPEVIGIGAIGAGLLVGSVLGAGGPTIRPFEQRAFRAINRLPGCLFYVVWAPMQLGNLVVGTAAGLIVAWLLDDGKVAIGVVAAMLLKLVVEKVARRLLRDRIPARQRPGTSEPGAIRRGADVPESGVSFPSGHVILVAAVGAVVWTSLPLGILWVPWALALLVALGRVYVGAHNPLDVTCGLGIGMLVGALLAIPLT
jgi:undecaprenyl-diphosphatase